MNVSSPYEEKARSESIRLRVSEETFAQFPEKIFWKGIELLKKSEFHVTLLHVKNAATLAHAPTSTIIDFFNEFTSKKEISLISFLDDFRYAEEEQKKTVLIRCTVTNLEELFISLNRAFRIKMPSQPPHVTLYSLHPTVGIHVNSLETMEDLEPVHLPELAAAFKKSSFLKVS